MKNKKNTLNQAQSRLKILEDARMILVCIAIKLELKGDEKKAFSSVVDFLTKRIVKLNNEPLTKEETP